MVQVAVGQEDVARSGELEGAPAHVQGEPRRMDAEPVVVPGARPAFDPEVSETQLSGSHGRWARRRADGGSEKRQISRYSQRRSGERRVSTLCQSGSISQSVAATEESSELPSCGVKQKP